MTLTNSLPRQNWSIIFAKKKKKKKKKMNSQIFAKSWKIRNVEKYYTNPQRKNIKISGSCQKHLSQAIFYILRN